MWDADDVPPSIIIYSFRLIVLIEFICERSISGFILMIFVCMYFNDIRVFLMSLLGIYLQ